ncbi:hypothetical protein AVEN_15801-1 [Araneus ventricosus]|uniref:Uncharacterized protein n=1 Tax=Araneus ventricosus TaxID=182803 RepID=A0A4Y2UU16_ARAVE|nr:hypothetical protein AVEN_15801-1 [Araneus ventricosus]
MELRGKKVQYCPTAKRKTLNRVAIASCYCGCIRRGVECIEYQVVSRHLGYEERQYPATTWVSTTTEGPSLTEANREMYKKLFGYIQGHNPSSFLSSRDATGHSEVQTLGSLNNIYQHRKAKHSSQHFQGQCSLDHYRLCCRNGNSYRNYSDLARSRPVCLNDGRCNSSRAEAGVLAAITGHGPALPVGGTHYHWQMESPSHYCTQQGSEIPLTYQAATHPHDHPQ